jgi:hypothetical protein
MKYKNIDSALHNLGHSFVGGTNYVDDGHVLYDVRELARSDPAGVSINFSTGELRAAGAGHERLAKAISLYRAGLAEHFRRHNVEPSSVREIVLHQIATPSGYETTVTAEDDRGVRHLVKVTATR